MPVTRRFPAFALVSATAMLLTAAAARAAITVELPDITVDASAAPMDFTMPATFSTAINAPIVGDDIAISITGPSAGLAATGAASGAARPAGQVLPSDPAFFVDSANSTGGPLYRFSDFLLSGSGTITDGSTLLDLQLHAPAGLVGTFHVDFYVDPDSSFGSLLYADSNYDPIPNLIFQGGEVTFVAAPEPASATLLGAAMLLLVRRARRKN